MIYLSKDLPYHNFVQQQELMTVLRDHSSVMGSVTLEGHFVLRHYEPVETQHEEWVNTSFAEVSMWREK